MTRVFIPQVPSRFDAKARRWLPSVNLQPAERFGTLVVMFEPGGFDVALAPCVSAMREQMRDFGESDLIVAVGDPSLTAAAFAIAARKTGGKIRLLKWDRHISDYQLVEFHI